MSEGNDGRSTLLGHLSALRKDRGKIAKEIGKKLEGVDSHPAMCANVNESIGKYNDARENAGKSEGGALSAKEMQKMREELRGLYGLETPKPGGSPGGGR